MYRSFFIHSFTDRHLDYFQHLAIINNAAMNIGIHKFLWIGVSGFWGTIPAVGSLDQKALPFLVFWRNSILFSTVAAPVCIPSNSALGFAFSAWEISNTFNYRQHCVNYWVWIPVKKISEVYTWNCHPNWQRYVTSEDIKQINDKYL